jgi:hypothetical protein
MVWWMDIREHREPLSKFRKMVSQIRVRLPLLGYSSVSESIGGGPPLGRFGSIQPHLELSHGSWTPSGAQHLGLVGL